VFPASSVYSVLLNIASIITKIQYKQNQAEIVWPNFTTFTFFNEFSMFPLRNRKYRAVLLSIFFIFTGYVYPGPARAQTIPGPDGESALPAFLDEMAGLQVITLNTAVKPYSRQLICEKLLEIRQAVDGGSISLNHRQSRELSFYLKDYRPESRTSGPQQGDVDLYRRGGRLAFSLNPPGIWLQNEDSLPPVFSMVIKPIAGYRLISNQNDQMYHRWQGAGMFGYAGKGWSYYAALWDNRHSRPLVADSFLTPEKAAVYTGEGAKTDFFEMKGGIAYTWKWGQVALQQDNPQWGDNYHGSNILSGRTPPFPYLSLRLKPVSWIDFSWFHGWLASAVIDSNRSYLTGNGTRVVYRNKYIAANFFTFTPVKKLQVSIGNSLVYSDVNIQPLCLIPFLFYKAADPGLSDNSNLAGQNAQFFFNISSRNIRNLHLYTSFFVDEVAFGRFRDKDAHTNFISGKAGLRLGNVPLQNVFFTLEYTRTNPMVYQHFIESLTYASNRYNLGHYLRDNSDETYLACSYRPRRGLMMQFSYTHARHGNDYIYGKDPAQGLPFMQEITWESTTYEAGLNWEIVPGWSVFGWYRKMSVTDKEKKYTATLYQGNTDTFETGFRMGF